MVLPIAGAHHRGLGQVRLENLDFVTGHSVYSLLRKSNPGHIIGPCSRSRESWALMSAPKPSAWLFLIRSVSQRKVWRQFAARISVTTSSHYSAAFAKFTA